MVRAIFGAIAGVAAAFATVVTIEYLGRFAFPISREEMALFDAQDPVGSMPTTVKLAVVLAWWAGSLAGAMVAGRIARRGAAEWVPSGLLSVAAIANVTAIPHPLWMSIAAMLAPLAGGWIGVRLARTSIGPHPA